MGSKILSYGETATVKNAFHKKKRLQLVLIK